MRILVTGSSGLIGSEAVRLFDARGHDVIGVDNNMRAVFFGPDGDTIANRVRLQEATSRFRHIDADIRDREALEPVFGDGLDAVIHCAAQPSHDRAASFPVLDFEVNALGTLNVLELTRLHCPDAAVVHLSTNKVYGDAPNELDVVELETRWDYASPELHEGIDESLRIDQSLHSLFGASKLASDVLAQEYGRYFGLRVGIFRGGCLTGPNHAGVALHGFLSYLVKTAVADHDYTVLGYKGKQVRDQIHSADVVAAFEQFIANPRPGEVYNLGGERRNSASVLECIALVEERLGRPLRWSYHDEARRGDHICYISDMGKFRGHYPQWQPSYSLADIVDELVAHETRGPS
ncbi:MAG TPA: NAD-dependent epimerase/dehydratase family protein [Acidimicrobiales bacterium]|nr:NAD-dependent epimerase/dehydratase family protein [Acidimicrobiales bacterium]